MQSLDGILILYFVIFEQSVHHNKILHVFVQVINRVKPDVVAVCFFQPHWPHSWQLWSSGVLLMALQSLLSFVCSASCVSVTLTEGTTNGSKQ